MAISKFSSSSVLAGLLKFPNASGIKASGGSSTIVSGGYVYHVFTGDGTFTPSAPLTCEILMLGGGGGGGGWYSGGGGGGGGLVYKSGVYLTPKSHTVTIGAGGTAGPASSSSSATKGGDTSFAGATFAAIDIAYGGGRGGQGGTDPGQTRRNAQELTGQATGNGGGGGGDTNPGKGGLGIGSYGQEGGDGSDATNSYCGGGGAGAGNQIGYTGYDTTNDGRGGNGTSAFSAWGLATTTGENVSGTVYFGGGGGAGSQGSGVWGAGGYGGGGRGDGNASSSHAAGTANTGGGGGGVGAASAAGKAGGSGIVIVRYSI